MASHSEADVTKVIARVLGEMAWTVLHYHPPSGQPSWCLIVDKKPVYPDIVAYRRPVILTVEDKGSYDSADIEKLLGLRRRSGVRRQLAGFVEKRSEVTDIQEASSYVYRWAHGFSGPYRGEPHDTVNLLAVGCDETVSLQPAVSEPLDLEEA